MIWQIRNNVDLEGGKVNAHIRVPMLEMEFLVPPKIIPEWEKKVKDLKITNMTQRIFDMASPRTIKTHLPLPMLSPDVLDKSKVIFVCREPKDCCVSFFHHMKMMSNAKGDFPAFAKQFREGTANFGDYWYSLEVTFPVIYLNNSSLIINQLILGCLEAQGSSKHEDHLV